MRSVRPSRRWRWTSAGRIDEIPTTCCGMAGSNGYETEHYERSLEAAEAALFPAIRAAPASAEIVAGRHELPPADQDRNRT